MSLDRHSPHGKRFRERVICCGDPKQFDLVMADLRDRHLVKNPHPSQGELGGVHDFLSSEPGVAVTAWKKLDTIIEHHGVYVVIGVNHPPCTWYGINGCPAERNSDPEYHADEVRRFCTMCAETYSDIAVYGFVCVKHGEQYSPRLHELCSHRPALSRA